MKIIHSADWQLHNKDKERQNAFNICAEEYFKVLHAQEGEYVQVFAGDMFENFNEVTNDAIIILYDFFIKAMSFSDVIVVPGNHDYDTKNKKKTNILDLISHIIPPSKNLFLYFNESKCYLYRDYVFANYCHFNGSEKPHDFEVSKEKWSDKRFIGLYHDPIQNAKTLNFDFVSYNKSLKIFEGCDAVLAGDIHQRQHFQYGKSYFVYAGSPYQLTHGENILGHGVVIWDETLNFEYVDIQNPYLKFNLVLTNTNVNNIRINNL